MHHPKQKRNEVMMMKKYTFDAKNGLWYEQCGEYRLPCLTVPNSKMIGR